MARSRAKGFTLIELLVVIAIIGILAAMLFPVFARARESARKIQCLSNIKNIAMAVQMYLTDYDAYPPNEHRAEVVSYLNDVYGCDTYLMEINPYLKWEVVLDEYIKNRDVWRCPAGMNGSNSDFGVNWGYGTGDWFGYLTNVATECRGSLQPCSHIRPPGWGGDITDSFVQNNCARVRNGGFEQTVGWNKQLIGKKTSEARDPARTVVTGDAGQMPYFTYSSSVAYPDECRINSNACDPGCGWNGSDSCPPATLDCGPLRIDKGGDGSGGLSAEWRKEHAHPRHLGGSNVGFADGHAKWFQAEAILFGGDNESGYADGTDQFQELDVCIAPVLSTE